MTEKIEAKVALVTGCSSGFGLLIAIELAQAGYEVYATMRNLAKAEPLKAAASVESVQLNILPLDVTKSAMVRQVVSRIIEKEGRIDLVVNNAGFGMAGFFEELEDEEIQEQLDTNFWGVVRMTRAVLPHMRERGSGRIINISSVSGRFGSPILSAYVISKFALEGFSESLSHEVAPFGIDVVLIEPGLYRTEIAGKNRRMAKGGFNEASPYHIYSERIRKRIEEMVAKCKADPRQVARLVRKVAGMRKPKLRYVVGNQARVHTFLSWLLPSRLIHFMIRKTLKG